MSPKLPQPIAAYIQAANAHDTDALLAAFTADAVVADEGRKHRGHDEIREWSDRVIREYQTTLAALEIVQAHEETVVKTEVSGNFDGSPIQLRFHFVIAGDKIAALTIDG